MHKKIRNCIGAAADFFRIKPCISIGTVLHFVFKYRRSKNAQ